jgi:ABC-type glycerol-3-phosphate transport system substrate-binding protein
MVFSLIFAAGCTGNEVIDEVIGTEETLKGTINIWSSEETKGIIEYSARLFNDINPDVNISVTAVSKEELESKLEVAQASMTGIPDILEVSTYEIPKLIDKLPNLFKPVDEDIEKIKSKVLPWKIKEVTIEDHIYAFPWEVNPRVVLYNKELASKYNLDPFQAKTWSEFLQMGAALKESSGGTVKLIALNEAGNENLYSSMLRQLKKPLYSNDSGIVLPMEENKLVLSTISQLINYQMVYALQAGEDSIESLKSGKALCVIADSRMINRIYNSTELSLIQWQVERFPAFEYGGKSSASGEGNAFMFTKYNESNTAASEFIRFMLTDNESNIFALKQAGIIPAVTDLYSIPVFNGSVDNFMELKIWRFMAEQGKEEAEITYDKEYSKLVGEILELEQAALSGQDVEALINKFEVDHNNK